jgi:hypothetical protein
MYEFIIHYKNGESVRQEFATHEEYWANLTEFAMTQEATPDISIKWAEWGPVLTF